MLFPPKSSGAVGRGRGANSRPRTAMAYKNLGLVFRKYYKLIGLMGHLLSGEHGKILGRLDARWGNVVCWSTNSNISETRKDRGKVTVESL